MNKNHRYSPLGLKPTEVLANRRADVHVEQNCKAHGQDSINFGGATGRNLLEGEVTFSCGQVKK